MKNGEGASKQRDVRSAPWRSCDTIYRLDARAFRDSDGDGIGDLEGVLQRMAYVELLGVDLLWFTGLLAAPISETSAGCEVDPVLGDIGVFDRVVEQAHGSGLRVAIDFAVDRRVLGRPGLERDIERSLRFWIAHGVDAFRVGVVPGLAAAGTGEVAQLVTMVRPVLDEFPGRSVSAGVDDSLGKYEGLQLLHGATDLRFGRVTFDAAHIRSVIDEIMATFEPFKTSQTWFIATWDTLRPAARFGSGRDGLVRARALMMVQLALPGRAGIDNGDELGLAEYLLTDEHGGYYTRGVMPWDNSNETFGFTDVTGVTPPAPKSWADRTVKTQLEDEHSMLWLYRNAIALRRQYRSPHGTPLQWYGAPPGCLAFRCGTNGLVCALNTTAEPVYLPPGQLLLASDPTARDHLPGNSAAWLLP